MNKLATVITYAILCIGAFGQNQGAISPNYRDKLEIKGIKFGAACTAELFLTGQGAQALGSFSPFVQLDLKRLHFGRGTLFVSGQYLTGKGINHRLVDAIQPASNLETEPFGKFVEAWYADSYLEGRLEIKAGRHYADSEFGAIESAGSFLNAGYGVIPTAPMPTYPNPELGLSAWASPLHRLSFGVAVYHGGSIATNGVFAVAESKVDVGRRTTVSGGAWKQQNNHGVYATAEHRIREGDGAPAVFARWGWAPQSRNDVAQYGTAGVVYRGIGLGVSSVRPASGGRETVYELFYKRNLSEHLYWQPDLQWMRHPAGFGPSKWVAGLRVGLQF